MPPQAVTRREDSNFPETPVIVRAKKIVFERSRHVEPHTRGVDVRRTFKTSHPKGAEQRLLGVI
jgi:hypothetical protein